MEGLIPMVFKAIKKNKTRRQYRCLSTGATQGYNLGDFYDNIDDGGGDRVHNYGNAPSRKVEGGGFKENRVYGHRRHLSCGGGSYTNGGRYLSNGGGGGEREVNGFTFTDQYHHPVNDYNNKQQLVRFRSHRMFSFVGC